MSLKFPITIKILYEKEAKDAHMSRIFLSLMFHLAVKQKRLQKKVKEVLEITLETIKSHQFAS